MNPSVDSPASCFYEGWVRHRRFEPVSHQFQYRIFMVYLDLLELPGIFESCRCWSATRWAPARFARRDYHGDASVPLDTAVRNTIQKITAHRPEGPIRLLTHLRYFGFCFNPVSFYYVFDPSGRRIEYILAEITNTPWSERRALVFSPGMNLGSDTTFRFRFSKDFHVSPFWPLDQQYDWRFGRPDSALIVHMKNRVADRVVFDATLSLKRLPIDSVNCSRMLMRYPLMTLRVLAGIHWQAARLHIKGAVFHPHPSTFGKANERHHPGAGFPLDPELVRHPVENLSQGRRDAAPDTGSSDRGEYGNASDAT